MGRSNHQDRRQCAAVYVAVVLQYAVCRHYGQGCVFIRAVHIVYRYRFVRFTPFTVIVTVATLLSNVPSFALYVKDIRAIEVRIPVRSSNCHPHSTSALHGSVQLPGSPSMCRCLCRCRSSITPSAATTVKVVSSSVLYTSFHRYRPIIHRSHGHCRCVTARQSRRNLFAVQVNVSTTFAPITSAGPLYVTVNVPLPLVSVTVPTLPPVNVPFESSRQAAYYVHRR